MSTDLTKRSEGWANPGVGSHREHYFGPDKRSLCGKYAYAGKLYGSPDGGCSVCLKRRAAQEKRLQKATGKERADG